MTGLSVVPVAPELFSGSPRERGQAQAASADDALCAQVRRATLGRVETARAEGLIDERALAYVAGQRRFAEDADPEGMAELAGIAEGFDLPLDELFLHLHLGTLRDLAGGAVTDGDGCSAWAVGGGPDGPLVVKNRDFGGVHLGVQRVAWHSGPDIVTGGMLCIGSLGSPGAYSSGMNGAGLALADTQIGARTHATGWLRYFVMTRVLARCATVAEALDWLGSVAHAGGGSLVLADAAGACAVVELGARTVAFERGDPVWRTNHFLSSALSADTFLRDGMRIDGNSAARLRLLSERLPARAWDAVAAARLMATHSGDAGGAPICQHPGPGEDTATLSSAIFAIRDRCVYFHPGNPCAGEWQAIRIPA